MVTWNFRDNISSEGDGPDEIGLGRKLSVPEADRNIKSAKDEIETLKGQAGKKIAFTSTRPDIQSSELTGYLYVHYTDLSVDGPFPMPIAAMRSAGVWTNSMPYAYLNVVTVSPASTTAGSAGVYYAQVAHVSPAAPELFDPAATDDSGNLLWTPMMPQAPFTPLPPVEFDGETKTLGLTDVNTYIRFTNTLGCEVTVPPLSLVAWVIGTEITLRMASNGTVEVIAGSGVTINSSHPEEITVLPWTGATVNLKYVAENEWDYIGPGTEV